MKILLLILVSGFLFAFSNWKNENRNIKDIKVEFLGENTLFITQSAVSKLLIQNQEGITDKAKRIIDLNELEAALKSNEMIKKAEVYMSIDGKISAEIEQKKPLARVLSYDFYIDELGSWMPLSENYSARVPLVTGKIDKTDLTAVYTIAEHIERDDFLKQHITEIHRGSNSNFKLRLRTNDIIIELGDTSELDKKFNNLKAFYQKALKDGIIDSYSKLNLRFTSQVICTKK
ncbi:MAG: hypothetical protein AAGH46_04355 [Bacteroidota bacterium]